MDDLPVVSVPRSGESTVFLRENSGGEPRACTSVSLSWDDRSFHLRYAVTDAYIWATQTKRDGPLWEEEVVEVFLDPVGDLQAYYEIEVNPLGAVTDLVLRKIPQGWRREFAWDCEGMESSVEKTSAGWNCSLSLPFAVLSGKPPRLGEEWRVNFFRIDIHPSGERELLAWSPTKAPTFHRPECFGRLRWTA